MSSTLHAPTVSPEEVARFAELAGRWWDPEGPLKPLHKMNPARLDLIKRELAGLLRRDPESPQPFKGLTLLDIGTGGGLVAEPMARWGFAVTGIDAAQKNVEMAKIHAAESGLDITYMNATTEDMVKQDKRYDVVLTLEIIEHVPEPALLMRQAASLLAPGAALVGATVSRTTKSYLLGIVGAELILRWLPVGTHDWNKFVKPSEFAGLLRRAGLEVSALHGLSYNPILGKWSVTRDLDVNYLIFAVKPGEAH